MISDLKFFAQNGLKWPQQKEFFSLIFFLLILEEKKFTLEVPFKRLFAPHLPKSDVQIFRDSESLDEVVSDVNIFAKKNGLKSPRQKKFFYRFFSSLLTPFKRFVDPTCQSPISKLF